MIPLLTAADVADLLKVETKWVERRAAANKKKPEVPPEIPSVKVGHYRRFRLEDVETYIAKHSTADPMQRSTRSKAGAR